MKERTGGGGKFIRLCGETTTDRKTLPPPCKEYGGVALRPMEHMTDRTITGLSVNHVGVETPEPNQTEKGN